MVLLCLLVRGSADAEDLHGQIKHQAKDQNCSLQLDKQKLQNDTIFEKILSLQMAAEASKYVGYISNTLEYNHHVPIQNKRQSSHPMMRQYRLAAPVDIIFKQQNKVIMDYISNIFEYSYK